MAIKNPKFHPMLNELVESIRAMYGSQLKRIILYGSYASDEATPDSDIDILVVLDKQLKSTYSEAGKLVPIEAELNLKYGVVPSCIPVSVLDYEKADTPFFKNVNREGVILHG